LIEIHEAENTELPILVKAKRFPEHFHRRPKSSVGFI
jgi:hypothetical protein